MNIRNIAIIAHVDHGKTTLVDQLLKSSDTLRKNEEIEKRAMDSNALEKERGITILAKTTSVIYHDYRINILDTPGHADFSGEVERIMHMVDGVLLVVDAIEGTMPQTRFVLKKALENKLTPIVVINKVDRPFARIKEVINEVYDLFIELGATIEQLDFPFVFASAIKGTSSLNPEIETQVDNMNFLFDTIINTIPEPKVILNASLQIQIALLDYNDYVGRIGIGLVSKGTIHQGETVSCVRLDGSIKNFRVQKLMGHIGLHQTELEEASAGDICLIAGLSDICVGETINAINAIDPLPKLQIAEPTLKMTFMPNTSPFAGLDGTLLTARKIEERLLKETEKDVSLRVERIENSEMWIVSGRGELHLSILIENMRREGFELQVSKPEIIIKEQNGEKFEPYEDVIIDIHEEYLGKIMEALSNRGAILLHMENKEGQVRLTYIIPSQGLIGFMTNFMTFTKGYGIISHVFREYRKLERLNIASRASGVLIATDNGKATAYSIGGLEDRGIMFIEPGETIYEGMIVGENNKPEDLAINVVKQKALTNMRQASKDTTVVLKRPKLMTLESSLDYINYDELVEITPNYTRMRKKILNTNERKKIDSHNKWNAKENVNSL